jgi:eukaryotic-like serine/threonine-protein kinase
MARTQQLIAGRFQVEREVGRGAVGIVFRAFDTVSQRRVALKIIAAAGEADPAERTRLLQEGKILSELDHPGIVQVVAYGALDTTYTAALGRKFDEGAPFIAMEWLEGEDLLTRQIRAALSMRQSLDVARQVAFALAAAHDAGVVHRDIKPSNIFILSNRFPDPESPPVSTRTTRRPREDGDPPEQLTSKLVDFGVATSRDMRLTGNDIFVGTPAYMAPEQARGDAIADARSDIYSLGATLFELLTGRPPHIGSTSIATIARLATTPAPRLTDLLLDVPERLDELVARMLMSEREHRPFSAREVALELDALCRDPSVPELARR